MWDGLVSELSQLECWVAKWRINGRSEWVGLCRVNKWVHERNERQVNGWEFNQAKINCFNERIIARARERCGMNLQWSKICGCTLRTANWVPCLDRRRRSRPTCGRRRSEFSESVDRARSLRKSRKPRAPWFPWVKSGQRWPQHWGTSGRQWSLHRPVFVGGPRTRRLLIQSVKREERR